MMLDSKISIAIPNYNYAPYLGETIRSVLDQGDENIEVVVNDNASTDESRSVVEKIGDSRIRLYVNPVNVGFAPNLDRTVARTTGAHVIVLCSDDIMLPGTLRAYRRALNAFPEPRRAIVASTYDTIDPNGARLATWSWPSEYLRGLSPLGELPLTDYASLDPAVALRATVGRLRNPLAFSTVCFPRPLWEHVGGYRGTRWINPDKWFHWRLLAVADALGLYMRPGIGYRVHSENQTAAAQRLGALKYLVDQYSYTWDIEGNVLDRSGGVTKSDLERAFIQHDVLARAAVLVSERRYAEARRFLYFGRATFPELTQRSAPWWLLNGASRLGGTGKRAVDVAFRLAAFDSRRR